MRLVAPEGELRILSQWSICLVPASRESRGIPSFDFQRKWMTSCVGVTLQDWDIRVHPGDGGDRRPQKGGDTLAPFLHGRDRSSSRAELREEVPEPRVCVASELVGTSQTKSKHLPDLAKIRYAFAWVNHWRESDDNKDCEDA